MGKKSAAKKQQNRKSGSVGQPEDTGRRKFIFIGAGTVAAAGLGLAGAYNAGWIGSGSGGEIAAVKQGNNLAPLSLQPDYQNALRAADEMLEHYARDLNNPSALIHAVRGSGKNFKLANGSSAVDYLCSEFAAEKEVNGKKHVYFKRSAEVHENSFLKTFLEAGVRMDQPVIAGGNKYTLTDAAESGKALFRCDPKDIFKFDENQYRYDTTYQPQKMNAAGQPTTDLRGELAHEHLPWGLIAFSILLPPAGSTWTNAYGETIGLPAVIDRSLAEYEGTCALGQQEMARGEIAPKVFRDEIKKYSCFGLHSVYSYLSCLKHGYRNDNLEERVKQMMDLVTYRLKSDAEAIDQDYAQEGKGMPPQLVDAFRLRALVKLYGHAFEAINYAKLHKLMAFSPSQERRIQQGEQAFYQNLVRLRSMDWAMMRKSLGDKFISDIVIALGHAARAMKLLTPRNPDTMA